MKKLFILIALAGNFIPAFAFHIEYGRNVVISQPVYEDVYIAGGNITINAPIYGDLIIAGGTIIINDSVTNDILLAGGNVTFNGFVGDDIRCIGGNIHISKNVTGDIVVAGGDVTISNGVTIGGLVASGGNITVDGNVLGEVRGAFGRLTLNGYIVKNIDCRGGEITINGSIGGKSVLAARNIIIGGHAAFNNDVRYWNKKGSVDFNKSLKYGQATYDPSLKIKTGKWYFLGAFTILGLLWYLGMALFMILAVQYLFSATMKKAADTFYNSTLKSLGMGFLFFIVVPVTAVVLFITLIGVPMGLLLILGYIICILLATVITSVVGANWFNNRYEKKWNFWQLGFTAFGMFVILKLISLAPFVGWLIILLMVCIAFGALLLNIRWKRKQMTVTAV